MSIWERMAYLPSRPVGGERQVDLALPSSSWVAGRCAQSHWLAHWRKPHPRRRRRKRGRMTRGHSARRDAARPDSQRVNLHQPGHWEWNAAPWAEQRDRHHFHRQHFRKWATPLAGLEARRASSLRAEGWRCVGWAPDRRLTRLRAPLKSDDSCASWADRRARALPPPGAAAGTAPEERRQLTASGRMVESSQWPDCCSELKPADWSGSIWARKEAIVAHSETVPESQKMIEGSCFWLSRQN